MDDIVHNLREGIVEHPRRWSGDTHDDLGGSADYDATDALMDAAADEIERLRSLIRAYFEAEDDIAGGSPAHMPAYHEARRSLQKAVGWGGR